MKVDIEDIPNDDKKRNRDTRNEEEGKATNNEKTEIPKKRGAGATRYVHPSDAFDIEYEKRWIASLTESGYRFKKPFSPAVTEWYDYHGYGLGGPNDRTYYYMFQFCQIYLFKNEEKREERLKKGTGSLLTTLHAMKNTFPPANFEDKKLFRELKKQLEHLQSYYGESNTKEWCPLTVEDYAELLNEAPSTEHRVFLWLLMVTGNRASNILLLRGCQISIKEGVLTIQWRIRKCQRKRRYRVNASYPFAQWFPELEAPRDVLDFLMAKKEEQVEGKPALLFPSQSKNKSQAKALLGSWTTKGRVHQLWPRLSVKTFRRNMVRFLRNQELSQEIIVALMDHTPTTQNAFYVDDPKEKEEEKKKDALEGLSLEALLAKMKVKENESRRFVYQFIQCPETTADDFEEDNRVDAFFEEDIESEGILTEKYIPVAEMVEEDGMVAADATEAEV